MPDKINLENICKKAGIFRCISHKKHADLKIESGVIMITACCNKFHDHIESFIERQIELTNNETQEEQL